MKELFVFCGKILMDRRAQRYALVDPAKLPEVLQKKLKAYASALLLILGGIMLLLIYARLPTFIISAAMIAWGLRQRARIGDDLDSRLKPWLEENSQEKRRLEN